MICDRCREAADGRDLGPVPVCSVCGQGPIAVYNNARTFQTQSVVRHKFGLVWCEGSKKPPRLSTGHDFCNGCPCQHRPRGSWKGEKT